MCALAVENTLGKEGRHGDVGQVHDVAHAEIHGDATNYVSLLCGPTTFLQQGDHVEHGVASGEGQATLALLGTVRANGVADSGGEVTRRGPFGRQEVAGVGVAREDYVMPRSLALVDGESDGSGCAHFDSGNANLAVTLSEVTVSR